MTNPDHIGGCILCRHWRDDAHCTHPAYAPMTPYWPDARDDETRCGTQGRLWEARRVGANSFAPNQAPPGRPE